jgi:hypothetical protein
MGNCGIETGNLGIPGGNAGIDDGNFGTISCFCGSVVLSSLDKVLVFTSSGWIDILTLFVFESLRIKLKFNF